MFQAIETEVPLRSKHDPIKGYGIPNVGSCYPKRRQSRGQPVPQDFERSDEKLDTAPNSDEALAKANRTYQRSLFLVGSGSRAFGGVAEVKTGPSGLSMLCTSFFHWLFEGTGRPGTLSRMRSTKSW
ncbi:hypothetical protein SAMN05444161_1448 [Rhizobiales bacterium GAS191]|nr:hypothetical protein SAMN05444161_1448 [Rhizobiales bacterium GAS191]